MFKVKTDFGYVLVEKDKIESISRTTPADETGSSASAKPAATKNNASAPGRAEANKQAKGSAIVNSSAARPEIPLTATEGRRDSTADQGPSAPHRRQHFAAPVAHRLRKGRAATN